MAQLTYNENMGTAYAGLLGDAAGSAKRIDTFNNPSEVIGFGLGVVKIVGDEDGIKMPAAALDSLRGVAVFDAGEITGEYPVGSAVAVLREGPIYVQTEGAVDTDSDVYVRFRSDPHVVDAQFSGALIVGNTVNGDVNGEAIPAVPFNTDNATTLSDLAAALEALDVVDTAVSNGVDTITITGANGGETLVVTLIVTGGASQATMTQTTVSGPSSGSTIGAFLSGDDDSGTGPAAFQVTKANFLTNPDANGVAKIEINLP